MQQHDLLSVRKHSVYGEKCCNLDLGISKTKDTIICVHKHD